MSVRPAPGPAAPLRGASRPAFLLGVAPAGEDRARPARELREEGNRSRLLTGAVAALAEHGYREISLERLLATAGVSANVFHRHFPAKKACFLAAYDRAETWLEAKVSAAAGAEGDWALGVSRATTMTLTLLGADLGLARLLASEILCMGEEGQARRRAALVRLAALLRPARGRVPAALEPGPNLERALASGAFAVLDRELAREGGGEPAALAPELVEFLLTPYLGHAEARRVARRGAPSPPR